MRSFVCIALAMLFSGASAARAAVPGGVSLQGTLQEDGVPVNASVSLHVAFYADSLSGTRLWEEDHTGVAVTNGIFQMTLGTATPFPEQLFDGSTPLWLDVAVNGHPIRPRLQIQSVPFVFTAASAQAGGQGDGVWQQNGQDIFYSGGNVAIGAPTTHQRLRVANGGMIFDNNWAISWRDAGNQTDVGAILYDNQNRLLFRPGATERMTIDGTSGYVGINTTHPPALLTVRRDDPTMGGGGPVLFLQNLSAPNNVGASAEIHFGRDEIGGLAKIKAHAADWYGQNYYLTFWTADGGTSQERLRITEDGKIGVGTTNPAGTWDLYGRYVVDVATPSPDQWNIRLGDGTGWRGNIVRGDGTPLVTFVDNGNVGIATQNPQAKLHVVGDLFITGRKSRLVQTSQGERSMQAIESEFAQFTTSGRARLQSGFAHIELHALWLETVTVNDAYPLDVQVTFYEPHGNGYAKPGTTGFDVIDSERTNALFHWTVTARQRGYENLRLGK